MRRPPVRAAKTPRNVTAFVTDSTPDVLGAPRVCVTAERPGALPSGAGIDG